MCNNIMVKYTVIKNMVYIYNSLHNHLHKQRQLQRTDVESRADTKPGLGVTCVCGGASISWRSFLLFASEKQTHVSTNTTLHTQRTSSDAGRSLGKSPSPLAMAGLAPYAMSNATSSLSLRPAAMCSGVFPAKVAALTLQPLSSK